MKFEQEVTPKTLVNKKGAAEHPASSRRKFLQKSSAAVLMTSLASQPVWGRCTVSGNLSGGSAVDDRNSDDCTIPDARVRRPHYWKSVKRGGHGHPGNGPGKGPGKGGGFGPGGGHGRSASVPGVTSQSQDSDSDSIAYSDQNAELKSAFIWVEDTDALATYIEEIKTGSTFVLPATPDHPQQVINIGQALEMGGLYENLANVWLNAHFGFFQGALLSDGGGGSPQDWVEHFYALHLRNAHEWGDLIFEAIYDDTATTNWNEVPLGYAGY